MTFPPGSFARIACANNAVVKSPGTNSPESSTKKQRSASPDDLHPRVLLRIVRGGDHDPALQPKLAHRQVDHLGADQADIEDVGTAVGSPFTDGCRHRGGGEPHVPANRDPLRLELLDV